MSGAGLIELLAARLGGRGARRAAPALREALAEVSARGANQSDPLVTVYRGGGDGQFWTPNAETAAGYGPVRRGMLDTNGFGSAEYTAEMANQSDDFGAFIQSQMARAESENLPGVTLDGIPDLPNWDIQRQYIVRDPSRLRDIAEHGPAAEAAPSLRDALSKINANRTGPHAGPVQGGRLPDTDIGGGLRRLGSDEAYIDYRAEPYAEEWFVTHQQIDDPAMRGQGLGVSAYEELIGRAREAGASAVVSDTRVSGDARRVYEALRRRGYSVVERDGRFHVSTADRRTASDGPRFRFAGESRFGNRNYRVPLRDGIEAELKISPEGGVSWGLVSEGGDWRGLSAAERSDLGLRAMRGIQDALVEDAGRFNVQRYGFEGSSESRNSLYQFLTRNADQHGFAVGENNGLMELRRSSRRTAPDGGPVQAGRDAAQRAPTFTLSRVSDGGSRLYTIPTGIDRANVELIVGRNGLVDWSTTRGQSAFSLPIAQRNQIALRAMRGVIDALGSDAGEFGLATYKFGATPERAALYRSLAAHARRNGFEMVETATGKFELRRNGPNAGSDRNALQRALRDRMNRE